MHIFVFVVFGFARGEEKKHGKLCGLKESLYFCAAFPLGRWQEGQFKATLHRTTANAVEDRQATNNNQTKPNISHGRFYQSC